MKTEIEDVEFQRVQVHSDAFFRSQRDINRHGSWLDFWKIQVNLVNFISGTFGTAWDKYSKNGLTFGCLREKKGWNFDLEIIFSSKNRILEFLYKHIWIFKTRFKKIWCQDFLNQLKNVQKVEKCRFFQHATFYFWNWKLQFLHLPKNHFCLIRSWTGKFMVDKLQFLWR